MKNKKCVFLIGFMSSGKSTIGRLLADGLGYFYTDTDERIEEKESLSIHKIFQQRGEDFFRRIENKTLREINCKSEHPGIVISTGGGLPCNNENISFMKEQGIVVYLKSSIDDIINRTGDGETRPVFQKLKAGGNLKELKSEAEKLFKQREKYYNQAHFTIINSNSTAPEKIAGRLVIIIEALPEPENGISGIK